MRSDTRANVSVPCGRECSSRFTSATLVLPILLPLLQLLKVLLAATAAAGADFVPPQHPH